MQFCEGSVKLLVIILMILGPEAFSKNFTNIFLDHDAGLKKGPCQQLLWLFPRSAEGSEAQENYAKVCIYIDFYM